jgi:hypothetical protein
VKLLADECCDVLVVTGLRNDVVYIKETAPGSDDESVLNLAAGEQRVLLTEDKDLPAYGIVLLRVNASDSATKLIRLRELFAQHCDQVAGYFVVVDESKFRIRPL